MIKCFQCLKDEYHQKIKYSQVQEAVVIISGQSYCFKHLLKELDSKDATHKENAPNQSQVTNIESNSGADSTIPTPDNIHTEIKKEIDKDYV